MVFSDLFFLFVFLPAFAITYMLASLIDKKLLSGEGRQSNMAKNIALVIFSLIFYAWGEPVYVFLMVFSVLVNYLSGLVIDRSNKRRRLALVIGLTCNIVILCTFKYLGFFAATLTGMGLTVPDPHISLPIGISFYTFQSISYLMDVYRRQSPVQRRFIDLLLYISMFPQLIAGPIVRYGTVAHEIHDRHASAADKAEGVYRFLIGLGKKVILANQLGEISDQFLKGDLAGLSTAGAWVGIVAFTLQIYFDFSGYSDMAIGMGRCLGFHFNENFNHPYCSKTITEFWRRWHMSLGSFFRDYVYIPLGGNRRHQALNIAVVWFLTGMWHGAYWNYILWGLYFGVLLVIEKYTIMRWLKRIPAVVLHVYALFLFIVGWGIFKFEVAHLSDFAQMGTFFSAFFGHGAAWSDFASKMAVLNNFWLWIVAIVLCMPVRNFVEGVTAKVLPEGSKRQATALLVTRVSISLVALVLSVALLVGATNNAFIYTRF